MPFLSQLSILISAENILQAVVFGSDVLYHIIPGLLAGHHFLQQGLQNPHAFRVYRRAKRCLHLLLCLQMVWGFVHGCQACLQGELRLPGILTFMLQQE